MQSEIDKNYIDKHFRDKNGNISASRVFKSPYSLQDIYDVYYDITETPVCKTCAQPVKFKNFKTGYYTYCSSKCVAQNKKVRKQV